jgi:hypothetical protein
MHETPLDQLIGRVVALDENDYMYGIGLLRLRLWRVTPMRSEPGWALVVGSVVDFRGVEHAEREVVVRLGALIDATP